MLESENCCFQFFFFLPKSEEGFFDLVIDVKCSMFSSFSSVWSTFNVMNFAFVGATLFNFSVLCFLLCHLRNFSFQLSRKETGVLFGRITN